jgi:putative oxidoreductase
MLETLTRGTLVPLLLRFGLAVIFIYHGLDLVRQDWGIGWAANKPDAPPEVVQALVAWGELVGGIAMALGFLTRLAAVGLAVIMIGAVATVHWPNGFDIRKGGYEYNFAILVICAAVFLLGPGTLAVDRVFRFRRRKS